MDKIIIRKATSKDLADIQRPNFDLFKKEYNEFDKSLDMEWTYSKEGKKFYSDRIKNENSLVKVVERDGKIIGYFCGSLVGGFYRRGIHAEMEDALVEEKFRSKGIGGKLMKDFLDWCKKQKVNYISAVATAQNEKAIKLYRKLGFKDYTLTLEKKIK